MEDAGGSRTPRGRETQGAPLISGSATLVALFEPFHIAENRTFYYRGHFNLLNILLHGMDIYVSGNKYSQEPSVA